ncbi:MAG: Rho-binding antiterminator [Kaistella sp.]|nr:Rho-binding antiterminator [Kaistella sp.]
MKKITFLALTFISVLSFAQEKVKYSREQLKNMDNYLFEEVFTMVSPSKNSKVILKDGRTVEGKARDLDRKKAQIYSIDIKDQSGNKQTLEASQIAEMYLPTAELEKAVKLKSYFTKVGYMENKKIKKSVEKDVVYFRNQKVSLKNKADEKEYLMQLINPEFSSKIEVYGDPLAGETGGVSIYGSPQIGGGVTKSFYVKKGETIIWLKKSDFEEHYNFLFGDNAEFVKMYPLNSIRWEQFSFLVSEYTRLSEEG